MSPVHLPLTPEWLGFAHPWALLLVLLVPLYWLVRGRRHWRPVIRFSGIASLQAAQGGRRRRIRGVLPVLRSVALICLIVAAARPQRADESTRIYTEGIAIQMVVDTSSSMYDTDLSPPGHRQTRLDVVKDVFRRFVLGGEDLPGRPSDLIGMIRFARYADSVCPLTVDHENLMDVLAQTQIVRPNSAEDGTAIGDGLALAVERLREVQRTSGSGEQFTIRSRVAIVLTDGENNAGQITPEQAGDLARLNDIKVYTILAGTGRRAFVGRQPVDDAALRHIAEVSGGRFFQADNPASLAAIYAEIDKLERTRTEEQRFLRWGELSFPWLLAAFCGLGLQLLLDSTWLRKIP